MFVRSHVSLGAILVWGLGLCVLGVLCPLAGAQSESNGKEKRREFGSSLRIFDERKRGTSGPSSENNDRESKRSERNEETIRVSTDLVISDVFVVDKDGQPVLGLKASDFAVKEDGKPQDIDLFAFGETASIPRSIVLIIDYGGSGPGRRVGAERSFRAALSLVDRLRPQDRMAIVTVDIKLAIDFTSDKKSLRRTLKDLESKKPLSLDSGRAYGALIAVLNEMVESDDHVPIVILQDSGFEFDILSGGHELLELPNGTPEVETTAEAWSSTEARMERTSKGRRALDAYRKRVENRSYGFQDVLSRVRSSRATIYSVIPSVRFVGVPWAEVKERAETWYAEWVGISRDAGSQRFRQRYSSWALRNLDHGGRIRAQAALIQTAALSGGLTNFVERPKDFEKVYSEIFTIIDNRYVIGYYPSKDRRDGGERTVSITVSGHPEYRVIGRMSYTPLSN